MEPGFAPLMLDVGLRGCEAANALPAQVGKLRPTVTARKNIRAASARFPMAPPQTLRPSRSARCGTGFSLINLMAAIFSGAANRG